MSDKELEYHLFRRKGDKLIYKKHADDIRIIDMPNVTAVYNELKIGGEIFTIEIMYHKSCEVKALNIHKEGMMKLMCLRMSFLSHYADYIGYHINILDRYVCLLEKYIEDNKEELEREYPHTLEWVEEVLVGL